MMTEFDTLAFAKAIADETRQEIMGHLCCVWCNVTELVEKLDGKVKQPTVSHHLEILQDVNLVLVRQEGKHRYYTLNQQYMTVCCGMLVRQFAPDYTANLVPVDEIPVAK
jgi:ArsR family transcriptional regulator, arsenate/arsenite/antimonite-responsive transcriptional repressor